MDYQKIGMKISRGVRWLAGGWDQDSFYHTFWHIVGATSPFIIVGLTCIFSPAANLHEFLKEGDFCLFSAAILTPGAYSLSTYSKKQKHPNKTEAFAIPKFFSAISICVIVISAIFFSWVYIHSIYPDFIIYEDLIVTCSIYFLFFSIFIFYYSRWLEEKLKRFDYGEKAHKTFDEFEKSYN